MPGTELTDDVNPLEAGLYHAVSLSKGCYMGQETLAKVHTNDAVKQQLWGLRLSQPGQPGDHVILGASWLPNPEHLFRTRTAGQHHALPRDRGWHAGARARVWCTGRSPSWKLP